MSRIVVTGGAGFIGSHLCEALLRRGDEVIAFDNFDEFYDPAVKRANLSAALGHDRFRLVEGDIRDAAAVNRVVLPDTAAVVHLAARAGVRPSIVAPLTYVDVNVAGTVTLLEACRRLPGCRFIFASSSSVYGNRTNVPFRESDRVDDPISPYAATKKAGELLCHTFHHLYGMNASCLRLFTVYGPRQRPDLAIHKFARLILAGAAVPVFGDGTARRDFTYIDDIVDGLLRALDRACGYRVYNLGEEQPVSVNELIALLEEVLELPARIERLPPQPGDVACTCADVSLALTELGYRPTTPLRAGLTRFAEWLRAVPAR
ncbi:MAG: GDP-mannose 4,6-dehydratase [Planctomycetes bacterium]|nr:GDP-mannose 4,6-dehydratase [Planctomycetota bacterium]